MSKVGYANGSIRKEWGRLGTNHNERFGGGMCRYPNRMFWLKYAEKISKGYVDRSDLISEKRTQAISKQDSIDLANSKYEELYAILSKYVKSYADNVIVNTDVSEALVNHCKSLVKTLYSSKEVSDFNEVLSELIALCPRKVSSVQELLANSKSDFPDIIEREEGFVKVLEALSLKRSSASANLLQAEVYTATDKQKQQVIRHLSDELKGKVREIYRVIPSIQSKRFNDYLKKNNIKTVKQLWHGSRNENWVSIIRNGLSLNPNAVITGKMFGNGIYFAPSDEKSWGYTSSKNAYWTRGSSDTAIMGLYATAYGEPLDEYYAHKYSKDTLNGKSCVHAHAGKDLRNDEIIYFSEDAMVLNYIVVFNA